MCIRVDRWTRIFTAECTKILKTIQGIQILYITLSTSLWYINNARSLCVATIGGCSFITDEDYCRITQIVTSSCVIFSSLLKNKMLWLYVLPCVLLLAILVVLGYAAYIHYQHVKYSHLPGPKLKSFFVGGSDFLDEIGKGELTLAEAVYNMHKEYGRVIKMFFFHAHFISVIDPMAAKTILMNNEFAKPLYVYQGFQKVFGQRFLGYGLVSETDTTKWERHRKIFNPAFHRKYLMELMHVFNDSSDRLIQYLSIKADGKTEVSLMDAFGRLTLDVIGKAGFAMGDDMVFNDTPFTDALGTAFEAMSRQGREIFLFMNPRYSAFKYRSKARKAIQLLRKTGEDIIRQRIEDQKQGKDLPKDILSFIIKEAIVEENFSIEEMVDEFVTFFGAGQETTANLLSFTLLCLGQNPEVLKKVLQEVDTIVGQKEVLEYEDIAKMEYLMLVLKETLRLYPPLFGTARYLHCKMEIAGYDMPVGTTIFFTNYAMSRAEDYFKNPLTFDPERFRRDEDKPLYVYFPFSMGPRSCIGQQFAMIQARVVIAKLFQKLSFSLVPGQKLGVMERMTLKPAGDCLNYITHRTVL